jgi:hypothetical protein
MNGLDTTALWQKAEELAQKKIDLMYPPEQKDIRARKFDEFRNMYYREMAFPPKRSG